MFFPIQSKAEVSSLCKPYHLPLKKIKVGSINEGNLSDFMSAIWPSFVVKNESSISDKEGKTRCWKLGDWNNSLCVELIKLYEKKIDKENFVFLTTAQHLGMPDDGCWSLNKQDCNEGAPGPNGSSVLGIFSFKINSENILEPTNYSGICEFQGAFERDDINLEQNGLNSYLWTVKSRWSTQGVSEETLFMIPAIDLNKNKPYEIAVFSVYHDNSGVEDRKERIDKVEYSFIINHNERYNLQLKHYCADIRYPKNMDMDVLEKKTQGVMKYQRSLISKYSINDLRYELPNTSEEEWSDVITWFSKRAHCPVRHISK